MFLQVTSMQTLVACNGQNDLRANEARFAKPITDQDWIPAAHI